jgi:hypothetical protein
LCNRLCNIKSMSQRGFHQQKPQHLKTIIGETPM